MWQVGTAPGRGPMSRPSSSRAAENAFGGGPFLVWVLEESVAGVLRCHDMTTSSFMCEIAQARTQEKLYIDDELFYVQKCLSWHVYKQIMCELAQLESARRSGPP